MASMRYCETSIQLPTMRLCAALGNKKRIMRKACDFFVSFKFQSGIVRGLRIWMASERQVVNVPLACRDETTN